ncbi:Endonuclease, partial [Actinidia chinensis var. chinensis]
MGGSQYFVIFVDDFSRYTWLYLLKNRSQLQQTYYDFARMIKTQFSRDIKVFRSDNAQEYCDTSFLAFLREQGTLPHRSCPGTSQQNGRAERKHRHLLDTTRALLISSGCPERFWGEAALTAAYTINRVPSPLLGNLTPYERLYGTPPDYHSLRVFGCACFVLLQPHERTKLEPRSRLCCFLGYGIEHKGYRCWDPLSRRLRVSRHVVFWEHKMFSSLSSFQMSSSSTPPYLTDPSIDLFPEDVDVPADPPDDTLHVAPPPIVYPVESSSTDPAPPVLPPVPLPSDIPVRRSTRVREVPSYLRDYHCFSTVLAQYEPRSYREASTNPLWQQAMTEELQALDRTHTWDLVDLPPGKSIIGCRWVYKIKTRADGTVERYKARLVAKGFTQEYGIDYEETFAPVARLTSVRSLLAVAATRGWSLCQMDVKNAFLNGDLTEEVYMQLPPGSSSSSNQVCRLRRALYGLKQAPRAWYAKFSSTICDLGFSASAYDSALFTRQSAHGIVLLLLYVDDMIITG